MLTFKGIISAGWITKLIVVFYIMFEWIVIMIKQPAHLEFWKSDSERRKRLEELWLFLIIGSGICFWRQNNDLSKKKIIATLTKNRTSSNEKKPNNVKKMLAAQFFADVRMTSQDCLVFCLAESRGRKETKKNRDGGKKKERKVYQTRIERKSSNKRCWLSPKSSTITIQGRIE